MAFLLLLLVAFAKGITALSFNYGLGAGGTACSDGTQTFTEGVCVAGSGNLVTFGVSFKINCSTMTATYFLGSTTCGSTPSTFTFTDTCDPKMIGGNTLFVRGDQCAALVNCTAPSVEDMAANGLVAVNGCGGAYKSVCNLQCAAGYQTAAFPSGQCLVSGPYYSFTPSCTPCLKSCPSDACAPLSDNCGGTLQCANSCSSPDTCNAVKVGYCGSSLQNVGSGIGCTSFYEGIAVDTCFAYPRVGAPSAYMKIDCRNAKVYTYQSTDSNCSHSTTATRSVATGCVDYSDGTFLDLTGKCEPYYRCTKSTTLDQVVSTHHLQYKAGTCDGSFQSTCTLTCRPGYVPRSYSSNTCSLPGDYVFSTPPAQMTCVACQTCAAIKRKCGNWKTNCGTIKCGSCGQATCGAVTVGVCGKLPVVLLRDLKTNVDITKVNQVEFITILARTSAHAPYNNKPAKGSVKYTFQGKTKTVGISAGKVRLAIKSSKSGVYPLVVSFLANAAYTPKAAGLKLKIVVNK